MSKRIEYILATAVGLAAPAIVAGQPTHEATKFDTAFVLTFAFGKDDPSNNHFAAWLDGEDPFESNVLPAIEEGHTRFVFLKAYGGAALDNSDKNNWPAIGTTADGDLARSRAWGPLECRDARPEMYEKVNDLIKQTVADERVKEVLVYIGAPKVDASWSDVHGWLDELNDMGPKISIGLDTAGATSEFDAAYRVVHGALADEIKVYVEPPPPYDEAEHWRKLGVSWVVVDSGYETRTSGGKWYTARELCAGDAEIVVILQGSADNRFENFEAFKGSLPSHSRITLALSTRGLSDAQIETVLADD